MRPHRHRSRVLAGLLIGVLVVGSFSFLVGDDFLQGGFRLSSNGPIISSGGGPSPTAAGRDPLLWPFSKDSIWNLPIGASAVYVPAGIRRATAMGLQPDVDVLILTPSAPITPVYYNRDAWDVIPGRCDAQGGVLFSAPIPSDFVVLGNGMGSPHGNTPNYATAILDADGVTLIQGQPFAHCTAGGTATIWWFQKKERLDGTGISGAHGGSMLSSIGGTIRLGELVPGGTIRHAMKLNIDGVNYYGGLGGHRWPASTADSCAPGCYTGSIPAMRIGSLLALPPTFDFGTLETEPARIVARSFVDYGAYAADNAAWSVYGLDTEYSPSGDVMEEFSQAWGFRIDPSSKDVPWARDMDRIFMNLNVVDNWNQAIWQTVSVSNGLLGAGLGLPRVPWAPDFGGGGGGNPDTVAPVSIASLTGTAGPLNWFSSPVQVTVSATDAGSGVSTIHVRTDGGSWQTYTAPVTVSSDGSHTVDYYATDVAGNNEAAKSVPFKIDTVGPVSSTVLSGTAGSSTWYLSPVQVTVSATDAGSGVSTIHVRTDGGAWQTFTNPITIQGDGAHTVDSYATDLVGHDGAVRTTAFGIDAVAPVSTSALDRPPEANGSYASPVQVTLAATDATSGVQSIRYRVDSGAWWTYTASFAIAGGGTHLLDYSATDVAGKAETIQSRSLVLLGAPSQPPIGTFSASGTAGANGWYVSEVRVTLSGASGSGSSTLIAYSLDGAPWALYQAALVISDGRHVLAYQVTDSAGNLAPLESRAINVDHTPPLITKTSPAGDVIGADGRVSWTGLDPVSGIVRYEVSVDGGPFQSLGTTTSVTQQWTAGSHVATVKAWDDAGNEGTTSIPFRVESSAPPPGQPGPDLTSPLQAAPPGSLYLAIGFILVTVGMLLLNRQKEELRRLRATRRGRRAY